MNELGVVFDIQRFSVHDGPGIRTIVFLKGCPLRCLWCCNPESQHIETELFYNPDKCIKCNSCFKVCQVKAIIKDNYNRDRIKRNECTGCIDCTNACPSGALVLKGKIMTVDEVFNEVEKDRRFFQSSDGGVTISGGEPFFQHVFLLELLKKIKDNGISTAVETSGFASWEIIQKNINFIDYFLYDIKHMDSKKHIEYTGVSNDIILSNLEALIKAGKDVTLRMPLIPGYNTDKDNIVATAYFAREIGIKKIGLLPYHNLGESKYKFLNRIYSLSYIHPDDTDDMVKDASKIFMEYGLKVVIGG